MVGLAHEPIYFDLSVQASDIEGLGQEFKETVSVKGTISKMGSKVLLKYRVDAIAGLTCDRSLEEFDEIIIVETTLNYSINSDLFNSQVGTYVEPDEIRGLRDDARWIDITDDVRQDITVGLPMKRIAPRYRGVEWSDGETLNSEGEQPEDDRWDVLKRLTKE